MGIGCGRAFEMAETVGSAFDGGQSPLAAFFRGPHPPWSPFTAGASPLVWEGAGCAEKVEGVDDTVELDVADDIDDEESLR